MISETMRGTDDTPLETRPEKAADTRRDRKQDAAPTVADRTLYRVCWASVFSAACGQGDPMSRDLAEFRAENDAADHPFRRYWVEMYRVSGTGVPTVHH